MKRVSAAPDELERCKVSVISQLAGDVHLSYPKDGLLPFNDHFHPARNAHLATERKPASRRIGAPFVSVNVIPREKQLIRRGQLDEWDFVLRKLFVHKATPLNEAIGCVPDRPVCMQAAEQS